MHQGYFEHLRKRFYDKEVFLFIEEIPIDGEDDAYGDFVKSLYALIILQREIYIMLRCVWYCLPSIRQRNLSRQPKAKSKVI